MVRKLSAAATIVATLCCGSSASAQVAETQGDLRCLMVSMAMLSLEQPALRQAGMLSAMYYFGRLDGRTPGLDLETGLVGQIEAMSPEDIRATAGRCGNELKSRGEAMQEVGKRIQERGNALPDLPASD